MTSGTKANPRKPPTNFNAKACMTNHVAALTELLGRMEPDTDAHARIAARLEEAREAAGSVR